MTLPGANTFNSSLRRVCGLVGLKALVFTKWVIGGDKNAARTPRRGVQLRQRSGIRIDAQGDAVDALAEAIVGIAVCLDLFG